MIGAFGTLLFFAATPVFANRAAGILGSTRANFWRLAVAAVLLGAWTYAGSAGLRMASLNWFIAGGIVGFGLGGLTMFHALPRIGSNLSNLVVQCGSAIAAAAVEWLWLGTRLTGAQLAFATMTIAGIAVGLSPGALAENCGRGSAPRLSPPIGSRHNTPPTAKVGVILALVSAVAQGLGAVISRKAFAVAAQARQPVDPGTAAFERVLGGLVVAGLAVLFVATIGRLQRRQPGAPTSTPLPATARLKPPPQEPIGPAFFWVAANALTGPVLGVTCFQWALRTTPAGIVQPIVAAAPLLTIPFAAYFERSRPRATYYLGACLAAAGVAGLAVAR